MVEKQATPIELDISHRLRLLMMNHKLTVGEMAEHARVSKSAMEKYLAGPSSPRATAIASLCAALETNAHWLLFGEPDNELQIIHRAVGNVVVALLNDLQQPGELGLQFSSIEFGTKEWRLFTWETGDTRASEAISMIIAARQKALLDAQNGLRDVRLPPHELKTSQQAMPIKSPSKN